MIRTLDVFYTPQTDKKYKVGRLAEKDRLIYFEYDKEFLQSDIQLSPYKLPLRSGLFVCDDNVFEGLFGLFGDSLPDGWGRLLLDRHFMKAGVRYGDITPLDRLSYVGAYGVGALTYEPTSKEIEAVYADTINLKELFTASQEILKGESDLLLDTLLALGGSSAGARPKVMVQLSHDKQNIVHGAQTLQEGYEHYMVKFASSHDSEDIAKIEYIYSLMAKAAGLQMSETALLQSSDNYFFATKRFDRVGDKRIHMHSVAGLTHSDFRIPVLDYDDLLGLTLHLTKSKQEQEKMYRLSVFNLFTHNRDDHAKNFSFLMDEDGEWKLSPAYDLTFSYGPGGEHSTTYLGEGNIPTKETLWHLAKKHDIKNAKQIIEEVAEGVLMFKEFAKEVDLSLHSRKMIEKVLL